MAGKTTESLTLFAQKKLLGKAHTSNLKLDSNESIPSFIAQSNAQVFGEPIPTNPNKVIGQSQGVGSNPGCVEYVVFDLIGVDGSSYDANDSGGGAGSDSGESGQVAGAHAYAFVLTGSYEDDSSNPKKGTGFLKSGQHLSGTLGRLQIVPDSFSLESNNPYTIELYKNTPFVNSNKIGAASNIDWQLDTSNGILFVQDFNAAEVPLFARGFIYTGDFADQGKFYSGVSGSLTQLPDGKSYLVAGNNVTITSASNGQVTISSTGGGGGSVAGSDTQVQFNDGGSFGGDSGLVFNKTTNTLTANNISGSLTKLSDGTSYILSNGSITVTSQSNGSIVLSAANSVFNEYIGEADGSNTRFTLDHTPTANKNVSVFVNGQLQMPATNITGAPFQDFSVTGSVIHFVTASLPPEGSLLLANYTTNQSIS